MNIDSLLGLPLDTLIAAHVFLERIPTDTHPFHLDIVRSGESWCCLPEYDEGDLCIWKPWPYSTADIWGIAVVQKMRERGYEVEIFGQGSWTVVFTSDGQDFVSSAQTFSLAVCRAALKAVTEKD